MEQMKISDYLENFNAQLKRGTCKVCRALVVWSRDRVASHKRRNCMEPPAEKFQLHSRDDKHSKSSILMFNDEFLDEDAIDNKNDFKISDYLINFTKETRRGNCKVCNTLVTWGKERVASHKRMSCTEPTPEVFLNRNRADNLTFTNYSGLSRGPAIPSIDISDYLENFNADTKRGTCKVCQALVFWSRERVASHKRRNCTHSVPEFFNFLVPEDKIDDDCKDDQTSFQVQDYLENFDSLLTEGTCKVCQKPVFWSSDKVATHKRQHCTEPPADVFLFYNPSRYYRK